MGGGRGFRGRRRQQRRGRAGLFRLRQGHQRRDDARREGHAYKVPGFGKDVSPDEVTVACEKLGYKQLRVYRRGLPPPGSKNPVETECTLQRI
jgi:hypothetical protein